MDKQERKKAFARWLRRGIKAWMLLGLGLGLAAVFLTVPAFLLGRVIGTFPSLQRIERDVWALVSVLISSVWAGLLFFVDKRRWHVVERLHKWAESN